MACKFQNNIDCMKHGDFNGKLTHGQLAYVKPVMLATVHLLAHSPIHGLVDFP